MFITLPMVDAINGMFGDTVRVLLSEDSDPTVHNFSRNSASPETLANSFFDVMDELGTGQMCLVREFETDRYDRLINLAVSHGYVNGEHNPNPAGMGLVTSDRYVALSTTWADAPAWVAAYIDPQDSDVRVIASGSGIWTMLGHGTISQTIALIQSEVERLGGEFNIQNLWVTTSPGARAEGESAFRLNAKGKGIALSGACEGHDDMIIQIGELTDAHPYALDLSGLVRDLWLDQGIDGDKLFFDERLNVEVTAGASKRAANAAGKTVWQSEIIAISLV